MLLIAVAASAHTAGLAEPFDRGAAEVVGPAALTSRLERRAGIWFQPPGLGSVTILNELLHGKSRDALFLFACVLLHVSLFSGLICGPRPRIHPAP